MRDVIDFLATKKVVAIVEIVLQLEVTVVIDILDTTVEIDFKDVIVESVHRDFLSMIVTIDLALQDMTVAMDIQRIMGEIIAVRDFRVGTEIEIQEVLIEREISVPGHKITVAVKLCAFIVMNEAILSIIVQRLLVLFVMIEVILALNVRNQGIQGLLQSLSEMCNTTVQDL